MELDDIMNNKQTPLKQRRVCPVRQQYQVCLDLYLKHELSCSFGLPDITFLPYELDNLGKNLGYHDMYDLKNRFHRIELDALNESNRRDGNPIPNEQMNALIKSFPPTQWIYFDSNYNTCLLHELDTTEAPLNYFEYYYGDYNNDFFPAKMRDAESLYNITFLDDLGFLSWLNKDGSAYKDSLPKVEQARLYADMTMASSSGAFNNRGPTR